jgi:hypothetical protein
VPDGPATDISGQVSIEFWIKPDGTSDADAYVFQKLDAFNVQLVDDGDVRRIKLGGQFVQSSVTSNTGLPAGVWSHVAITHDGNQYNIYVNGEADNSISEDTGVSQSDNQLVVGANDARNGRFFSGELDNVRLYDRSRTLIEIRSNYQEELDGTQSSLSGLYQFDGGTPVDNVAGGGQMSLTAATLTTHDALPVAPDVYVAERSNGSVTVEWDDRSAAGAPTVSTYRVYRTDFGGTTLVASGSGPGGQFVDTNVTNGVTYDYRVEYEDANGVRGDRSKAVEARPFGRVGAVTESPRGGGNGVLRLGGAGSDGYGEVPDQAPTDISGEVAVEFWLNHDGTSDPDAFILQKQGAFNLQLAGDGEERRIKLGSQFVQSSITSDAGVPAGVWTHVAVTYDGSQYNLYINGTPDGSVGENTAVSTSGNRLVVGANDARSGRFFHGRIDNLRLWDVSRTADQIEANYSRQLPGRSAGLSGLWQFDDVGNTDRAYGSTYRHNNITLTGDAAITTGGAAITPPDTFAESGNESALVNWDVRESLSGSVAVYRTTDPSTGYSRVADGLGVDGNYTDTGLTNGETYYYATTFVAADGRESDFAKPATATPYAADGGASLELDGQSSALVTDRDSVDVSQQVTIEFWLNHDGTSDADAYVLQKQGAFNVQLVGSGEDRPIKLGGQFVQSSVTSSSGIPAGEWTHVAITYDGSQYNLYVNGRLDGTTGENTPVSPTNNDLRIGSATGGNERFLSGRIDELRLWDVARTDDEIRDAYRSELIGNETGLDAYWRFDDPSTTVARGSDETHGTVELLVDAEVSATGALPVQPRVYARGDDPNVTVAWQSRDDAPNATTVLRSSSPDLTGATTVATRDADRTATLVDNGTQNGNTVYYTATTTDDDGQTSDRALVASALPSAGAAPFGNALRFANNQSSASVSPRPATRLDGVTGTVEAWVNFDADAQQDAIVMKRGDGWQLYLQGSGAERRFRFGGGGFAGGLTAPADESVTAGQWNHVAVTRNGAGDYSMYLNGRLVNTANDGSGFDNGGDATLAIGSNVAGNARLLNGDVDELRVWNTHRTADQIDDAYDRELTGFEPGLAGYWRGCSDPTDDTATRGSARKPMTMSLTSVACVDSTVDGQSGGGVTTTATVVLEGAPDGLRGYRVELNTSDNVVLSVTPDLISGQEFGIESGGPGTTGVTAAGAELLSDSGTFTDNRTLFEVEIAGNVSQSDLQLTVLGLLDDNGDDVPSPDSRVSVTLSKTAGPGGSPFTGPLPGTSGAGPPTDTNDDGVIEDINGDGTEDFLDVIAFLFALDQLQGLSGAKLEALDYNDSNAIDFLDIVQLLFNI